MGFLGIQFKRNESYVHLEIHLSSQAYSAKYSNFAKSDNFFMLGLLKQKSLERNLNKQLNKRDFSHRNSPIEKLGFLVEDAFFKDIQFLLELGRELNIASENIGIYTFSQTGTKAENGTCNRIVKKDFNWLGEIKNPEVLKFVETPFHALIGIQNGEDIYFKTLIAQSKAHFKIGFKPTDEAIFDMILTLNPFEKDIVRESLKKYLKVLKKI